MTTESLWQSAILYGTWIRVLFSDHMKERWIQNTTSLPLQTSGQVKRMMAITRWWAKSPTSGSWYKSSRWQRQFGKVCERKQKLLMDFQKTASILFVRWCKICLCSLHDFLNDNELIDHTGGGIEMIHQLHKHPPSIIQVEDNTLSSSLSDTLSLSSSNKSSRFLTSGRSKINLDDDDLFSTSSQSTKKWHELLKIQNEWKSTCQFYFFLLRLGYGYPVRKLLQ